MDEDAAIWAEVRGEVAVLERELRELDRDAELKQAAIRELRETQQTELNPRSLVHRCVREKGRARGLIAQPLRTHPFRH